MTLFQMTLYSLIAQRSGEKALGRQWFIERKVTLSFKSSMTALSPYQMIAFVQPREWATISSITLQAALLFVLKRVKRRRRYEPPAPTSTMMEKALSARWQRSIRAAQNGLTARSADTIPVPAIWRLHPHQRAMTRRDIAVGIGMPPKGGRRYQAFARLKGSTRGHLHSSINTVCRAKGSSQNPYPRERLEHSKSSLALTHPEKAPFRRRVADGNRPKNRPQIAVLD
jgi:hypothetical protein